MKTEKCKSLINHSLCLWSHRHLCPHCRWLRNYAPESTSPYPTAASRPCRNAPSTTPTRRQSFTERITDQVGRWYGRWVGGTFSDTGPKRRTGHVPCCPVNRQTLTWWSGWTICVHARNNNRQLGFLPLVGMCSATSAPLTATDISHTHLIGCLEHRTLCGTLLLLLQAGIGHSSVGDITYSRTLVASQYSRL